MTNTSAPAPKPITIEAIITELTQQGVHNNGTPAQLEAYAGQLARLRDAQQRIHDEGLIVPDTKHNPTPHPAIAIERAAQDELRKWGDLYQPNPL